jgi:hypothetical protein
VLAVVLPYSHLVVLVLSQLQPQDRCINKFDPLDLVRRHPFSKMGYLVRLRSGN